MGIEITRSDSSGNRIESHRLSAGQFERAQAIHLIEGTPDLRQSRGIGVRVLDTEDAVEYFYMPKNGEISSINISGNKINAVHLQRWSNGSAREKIVFIEPPRPPRKNILRRILAMLPSDPSSVEHP